MKEAKMKKWLVILHPSDYSVLGVRPQSDNQSILTISGAFTLAGVEADTEEEAKEKAPKQAMLEEITRLKKEASDRWIRDRKENERREAEARESVEVVKQFYGILCKGRFESYCDGKYIHIEWYSPNGLRKVSLKPLPSGLLKAIVNEVSKAPLVEECY